MGIDQMTARFIGAILSVLMLTLSWQHTSNEALSPDSPATSSVQSLDSPDVQEVIAKPGDDVPVVRPTPPSTGASLVAPTPQPSAATPSASPAPPAPATGPPIAGGWFTQGSERTANVSGVALIASSQSELRILVVRDNKKAGENRASEVVFTGKNKPVTTPLAWSGALPVDLETVDAVPGRPGEFIACTSAGKCYHIALRPGKVTVLGTFSLPGVTSGAEYESFSLVQLSGMLVAAWADRGKSGSPSKIFAAPFDLAALSFGTPVSTDFSASDPAKDPHNISDMKIMPSGRLLVTSAWEASNNGPFNGALLYAGAVSVSGAKLTLTPAGSSQPLLKLNGQKPEAVVCVPGSTLGVVGTDNENKGGALGVGNFCTA